MSQEYSATKQPNRQPTTATSMPVTGAQIGTASKGSANSIRWRHVLILGGLSALGPLSTDMYLPALPTISRGLGGTMAQTQLTLSAGILGLALGQVIAGPISDTRGRRGPLLVGLVAYAFASLLCIVAPSIAALTVLRFVQGLAGASGIVIALAIVNDLYTGLVQARFFALLMQISGLAPILAPMIGSQLLTFTSWRGVFVTLAIIGVMLFLAAFSLGETLPLDRRQGGGRLALFHTFRDLLTDRRFVGYALASGFAFAAAIVYISVSPFILQNIYGFLPQRLGLVFGINALGLVIMAQIGARLVGRVAPQTLLTWGLVANTVGGLSLLGVVLSGVGLVGVLPSLFVIVASLGLIAPNATALALANTRTAGSASALLGVLQFSIGALTAPLVGLGGTTTAVPMAATIVMFGIAALVTFIVLCRPTQLNTLGK